MKTSNSGRTSISGKTKKEEEITIKNTTKLTDQKPIWETTLSGLMVEQTELWWSYDKCKNGWEKMEVDKKLHDWQIRLKDFIKEVETAAYERAYKDFKQFVWDNRTAESGETVFAKFKAKDLKL